MHDELIKDNKYLSVFFNKETDRFSVLDKNTGEKIYLQQNIRFDKKTLDDLDNISEEEAVSFLNFLKNTEALFSKLSNEKTGQVMIRKKHHSTNDPTDSFLQKLLACQMIAMFFALLVQIYPIALISIWQKLVIPAIRFLYVVYQYFI